MDKVAAAQSPEASCMEALEFSGTQWNYPLGIVPLRYAAGITPQGGLYRWPVSDSALPHRVDTAGCRRAGPQS